MKLSKKIVLLGHFGVGKTSLFRRFMDDKFSEDYKVTLGVQIKKKVVELPDGRELSMIIWDTEGHTNIEDTRKSYLLGSGAFIYVFDITREDTYQNIQKDLKYLSDNYPKVITKVLGNKLDLVNEKETKTKLEEMKVPYDCLASAKTSKNVQDFFVGLAKEIV